MMKLLYLFLRIISIHLNVLVILLFEHKCFLSANYMPLRNEWCDDVKNFWKFMVSR